MVVSQEAGQYDKVQAQEKWQAFWEEDETFRPRDDGSRERRYVLDMFPYPSGDLHMGHAEAYAMADVIARYWRLKGYDVMHPIGWDSFGLPAENAAIKADTHPATWTYNNIETQARSFKRYGLSFDWSRRLHTSDEDYYKWTQWLFTRFYERGLAYRKDSFVNWCPKDQTVLANEQVVDGRCERCKTEVTKRKLNQWYFKITEYAEQLLDDMTQLEGGWPDHVLAMQRNWIGRSEGAHVDFRVEGRGEPITVFTTRPDTLFGATFMVVAPDAPLAAELVTDEQRPAFETYLEQVKKETEIERQSTERVKTGVWLGRSAINPVNGEEIPIWAADYVLADYGTGAIMAVPAHDQRDLDFARQYGLPVRTVIDVDGTDPADTGIATSGDGAYVNSGPLTGLADKASGVARIIAQLEADGLGTGTIQYRLRDWLLSRQRFWGCPIPVVHCDTCGEVPVPDDQLPVRLPDLRGAALAPKGTSPLAAATDWVATTCPTCHGPAKRDTDTMDTFVDSSWYFFRYCSPGYDKGPFDPEDVRRWMPVAQYVGGVEHAILHLLYMRFFSKVLRDMGLVDFDEPMLRLLNQGQVINQGKAMSKSLGNGVDLGKQIDEYGVDAVRLTMVFAGPPEDDIDWADLSPASSLKFLQRAYRIASDVASPVNADVTAGDAALRKVTHKSIADVSMLIESGRFNVAVARVMELVNATRKAIDGATGPADPAVREAATFVAQALSVVAPYVAEEMWEVLGHAPSVASSAWPVADPALTADDTVTMVVQIQGKIRAKIDVPAAIAEDEALALALADAGVQRSLDGREVAKVIARLPKMLSLVPR
ncbi:leucine--tRNA ligase [Tessaracoccus lapidicaptus]|uniref:Leucine--tRNA ligase n=1 Tax=Tessaracoccus lapidicaptus TaxID=1427523 RepID=A0A1C0AKH1_9ACTN|nr:MULTISPECIES: leucine--tRNA ligase [Tessaracoccus]AQX16900.1 leucine--tRNA ligase [Tessaracoccus sp. T2.5-30]OCL33038.1 leucine--tRNA ligase [Tessaracoccus lapidicaptus]